MVSTAESNRRWSGLGLGQSSRLPILPRRRTMKALLLMSALSYMLLGMTAGLRAQPQETGAAARRVIIFVWDGLRADDLTPEITPNYFALARSSVVFADHHAVYPTFTMMNSASIATGAYPGVHGFYGNVVYAQSAVSYTHLPLQTNRAV